MQLLLRIWYFGEAPRRAREGACAPQSTCLPRTGKANFLRERVSSRRRFRLAAITGLNAKSNLQRFIEKHRLGSYDERSDTRRRAHE